ncbi:M20/M25/M40 family metallo-hydrolase [Nocardia sp. NBC_00565]|uniref:M20/M25/M40 family metallo-hydrolase n=1 Tax=Nocardia sp. NBC_00565 TaxID=2975993 RepID=UPI002E81F95C|nr:M20/M25/M40 family metallo-hydrolase [Nocardia sp. NBC_00565]WUC04264.1 M20/M25/M40 family metallo-hydrolase [Nocardia sp. NBC_00565]
MTSNAAHTHPAAVVVDADVAERLAQALRCATISHEPDITSTDRPDTSDAEFVRLAAHLEQSFPLVHAELELERFGHSRLYRWAGAEPDQVSAILLAHQDVVPCDDLGRWTHPPFAGVVDDEFIWGRGAIDDKSRLLAILEAVESALAAGIRPRHTIYLAFGHDEEAFGDTGASLMARRLRESGVHADLLLDEGGVILDGVTNEVDRPVASIMVGEKGYVTVRLSVTAVGGHSSMPGRQTAVGRIARAVGRIQDHPMPLRLTPVVADMLERLRQVMPAYRRRLLRFARVAAPVITRVMAASPQTEALVRTTTAPTVIRGGVKPNVLPQQAEALVNFRILPGDSIASVLAHCRKVVRDADVRIEVIGKTSEPSPGKPPGPAFDLIAGLATAIVPGIAVTTGIVPGATDSRHYDGLAATRCNFAPIVLTQADLETIHGTDERISLVNYARLIEFNRRLIDQLAAPPPTPGADA